MRMFVALLLLCIVPSVQATEPKQLGSAAWALAVAKHRLTMKSPSTVKKSCNCSSQCVCGCNAGQPCSCGNATPTTGCTMVNGVMVCPK